MAENGRPRGEEQLAAALAAGQTVRDAATVAGVSERTARRRLSDASFNTRVTELRAAMIAQAAGRLAEGMGEAAAVLRKLLTSADEDVQHRAAVKVIELGVRMVELSDLQRQVEEIERRISKEEHR